MFLLTNKFCTNLHSVNLVTNLIKTPKTSIKPIQIIKVICLSFNIICKNINFNKKTLKSYVSVTLGKPTERPANDKSPKHINKSNDIELRKTFYRNHRTPRTHIVKFTIRQ